MGADAKFPLPFPFPAKLHILCVSSPGDADLKASLPLYQKLIDINAQVIQPLVPIEKIVQWLVNLTAHLEPDTIMWYMKVFHGLDWSFGSFQFLFYFNWLLMLLYYKL